MTRFLAVACAVVLLSFPACAEPVHGASIYGKVKYGKDFQHFDYVNPDAPKGGELKLGVLGTFDSFNPFIVKGISARGISYTFDTLLHQSEDEPFSMYGLIAQSFEIAEDRTWIEFHLNPKAIFHDGTPILADDVVFSFNTLRDKGSPVYRHYYGNVKKVRTKGKRAVRFEFKDGSNRELPLILGQMHVLSKSYWENRDFSATTLEPPLGSGPYKVAGFEQGRGITYERVQDYWAEDLPVRKGSNNFDKIIYDYYMDSTVALQAIKSGAFDIRIENEAKKWETGYNNVKSRDREFIKREFDNSLPAGAQGYVFNTRRTIFADARVREALSYAFDFEWVNRSLFYGHYKRTRSYFDNSPMAATGLPSKKEQSLLMKYKGKIPPRVFTEEYNPPTSDGTGYIRDNLTRALKLLSEAGWKLQEGRLVNEVGEQFKFELLFNAEMSSAWERVALSFVRNLKKLGIEVSLRSLDATQYQNRLLGFDFDMTTYIWGQSLSPGTEQRYYWGSSAADTVGSYNFMGIKDDAVDELIELIIAAENYDELTTRTKALDRVLQWNFYMIPHWYLGKNRLAYWDKFGIPETIPMQGVDYMNWWVK